MSKDQQPDLVKHFESISTHAVLCNSFSVKFLKVLICFRFEPTLHPEGPVRDGVHRLQLLPEGRRVAAVRRLHAETVRRRRQRRDHQRKPESLLPCRNWRGPGAGLQVAHLQRLNHHLL